VGPRFAKELVKNCTCQPFFHIASSSFGIGVALIEFLSKLAVLGG
jgi:hypothetical protein